MDIGRQTLSQLQADWWKRHVQPHLARTTKTLYLGIWGKHVEPRLGDFSLIEITPDLLEDFVSDLRATGVGAPTITKCLVILQSMLGKAVAWGRLQSNPVKAISKPKQMKGRTAQPLSPSTIEAIRKQLGLRDATLVSVLAYAGLRPGEAFALRWGDIRDRTILVERAASVGEIKETKTGRTRTVKMVSAVVSDLGRWKIACGRPNESDFLFPRVDGGCWTEADWKSWKRRSFKPAANAIGLLNLRPYDLRHTFCSLLLAEGRSVVEVAAQAGHAPAMTLSTYGHVIAELEDAENFNMEAAIRSARNASVPPLYPGTNKTLPGFTEPEAGKQVL